MLFRDLATRSLKFRRPQRPSLMPRNQKGEQKVLKSDNYTTSPMLVIEKDGIRELTVLEISQVAGGDIQIPSTAPTSTTSTTTTTTTTSTTGTASPSTVTTVTTLTITTTVTVTPTLDLSVGADMATVGSESA